MNINNITYHGLKNSPMRKLRNLFELSSKIDEKEGGKGGMKLSTLLEMMSPYYYPPENNEVHQAIIEGVRKDISAMNSEDMIYIDEFSKILLGVETAVIKNL